MNNPTSKKNKKTFQKTIDNTGFMCYNNYRKLRKEVIKMTTYRVERFTEKDYHNYMTGGYNYRSEDVYVEANSKEEAIARAQKAGYIINEYSVKTVEEIEERERKFKEWEANQEAKAKAAKAKREATEARKAAEAGMTVAEYRKEKARKATITRLEREIANMEKELENKKRALKRIKG